MALAERLITALERNTEVTEALLTRATSVSEVNRRTTTIGPSRSEMARSFLKYLLKEQDLPWADILAAGAEHGHTPATLRDVRHDVAEKIHRDGHWFWHHREDIHG